jgi:hypothetical protein
MSQNFAWEAFYAIGAVILALALAWGAFRYYTRNRANDAVTERATHALYEHGGDRYEREDRPRLQREIKRR